MDQQGLFPMDFQGAVPEDGVIHISSDESMECLSTSSVEDLNHLSDPEDDDIKMSAQCIERQMEILSTSRAIPVPENDFARY